MCTHTWVCICVHMYINPNSCVDLANGMTRIRSCLRITPAIHIFIYIYKHVRMYVYIYMHMHVCVHMYVYLYMHMYECMYVFKCI